MPFMCDSERQRREDVILGQINSVMAVSVHVNTGVVSQATVTV